MIRDKYEVYTIEQLEKFIKYLEVRKRDKNRYGEVSNITINEQVRDFA